MLQKVVGKMRKAIEDYNMIEDGDKIAVGLSGGKDSITLLNALNNLRRYYSKHFDIIAITIHPGGENFNTDNLKKMCDELGIEYIVYMSNIFEVVFDIRKEKSPCSLCANLRRGMLNSLAIEHGCNKIALGHHFDDVIETTLLSMFYGSEIKTMIPKLHSENFEGLELIRPLYLVKEESIISWRKHNDLTFINCACRFTEGCSLINDGTSKRKEVKELIKTMKQVNPNVDQNIFKALDNVNLDCILGTKKDKVYHSFLEDYEK